MTQFSLLLLFPCPTPTFSSADPPPPLHECLNTGTRGWLLLACLFLLLPLPPSFYDATNHNVDEGTVFIFDSSTRIHCLNTGHMLFSIHLDQRTVRQQ